MNEIKLSKDKMKIANLLRLARKANSLALGRTAVRKSVLNNKSYIIFSGKRNDKLIENLNIISENINIEVCNLFDDDELSYILGRKKLTLVAVDDKNFANGIKVELEKFKD